MKKFISLFFLLLIFLLFSCSKAKFYYQDSETHLLKYPRILNKEIITYDDSLKIYANFTETPIIERQFPPDYPREASQNNWQGNVVLTVEILASGNIGRIILKKTSGYKILDEAAISASKKWKFTPAKSGNKTVSAWLIVEIQFKL